MTDPIDLQRAERRRVTEARDRLHLDPSERAERLNTFLFVALGLEKLEDLSSEPLYWDLVCFCQAFLNHFAVGLNMPELLLLNRILNEHIYTIHYSLPNSSPQLGPSRDEHNRIWAERIEAF